MEESCGEREREREREKERARERLSESEGVISVYDLPTQQRERGSGRWGVEG